MEEGPVIDEPLVPQHPVHHRAGPRAGSGLARVEHPHASRVNQRRAHWAWAYGGRRRHRAGRREDGVDGATGEREEMEVRV